MNDTQLLELLAMTDALADDTALPEGAWTRDAALDEIERRMSMPDTKTEEPVTATPRRPQRRTWLTAAAAFVIVVVAGVAIALASRSPEAPPAEQSTTTTTEAPTTTTTTEQTTTTTPTTEPAVGPTTLARGGGTAGVAIGTYVLDTFEPPITFTVDPAFFFVQFNATNRLALSAPNSFGPGDRDMVLFRLAALSDPAEPQSRGQGWPAEDFAGWLDNPPPGVVVVNREDTTLGGVDAIRADLALDETECPESGTCALLGWSGSTATPLETGSIYRVWVIDDGAEAPLVAVMTITNEGDRGWIDAFDNLLSTFEFGE